MSWITVICSTTAAACATLAAIHAVIWLRDRSAIAQLGFSGLAAGVAWFTWAEFAQMRARTPAEAAAAFQWIHAAIFLMVAGMTVFVRHYFRTARPWLGHAAWTTRLLVLLVGWSRPFSADYDEITGIVQVPFAGGTVSVTLGRTSAWHWIGQAGFALLVLFVIDASIRLWRTGDTLEKRRAVTIGGTTAVFALLAPTWAALIFANVVRWPHVEFLFVLPLVLAVGYELGDDVLRAARLTGQLRTSEAALRQSEHGMMLAANAARELSGRLPGRPERAGLGHRARRGERGASAGAPAPSRQARSARVRHGGPRLVPRPRAPDGAGDRVRGRPRTDRAAVGRRAVSLPHRAGVAAERGSPQREPVGPRVRERRRHRAAPGRDRRRTGFRHRLGTERRPRVGEHARARSAPRRHDGPPLAPRSGHGDRGHHPGRSRSKRSMSR